VWAGCTTRNFTNWCGCVIAIVSYDKLINDYDLILGIILNDTKLKLTCEQQVWLSVGVLQEKYRNEEVPFKKIVWRRTY
jgi:hypothetical protein